MSCTTFNLDNVPAEDVKKKLLKILSRNEVLTLPGDPTKRTGSQMCQSFCKLEYIYTVFTHI